MINKYMIVVPFESVGDLFFSDKREEIRKKLNEEFTSGIKGDENDEYKEYYDYFKESELFVYYDKTNTIKAFEFFKSNPIFNNVDLLKISYHNLVRFLLELDPDLINNYNDFTSIKNGIGGNTSDDPKNENASSEAVIIFKKGYYDLLDSYL